MSENCRHCGKEIDRGGPFCPECRSLAGEKKTRRIWVFSILFSAALLFLTGLMVWDGGLGSLSLSLGNFLGKPAAVINGESISRKEFQVRMTSVRSAIERQHGKNTFSGGSGEALLGMLAQEVLDGMLEERLVAQEAAKLKIEIPEERVEAEVERISKEIYGTWERFQDRLREDGISPDELKAHIRNLLLSAALKEAKTPPGADPEVSFNVWVNQARQKAHLIIYERENRGAASSGGGTCCASGRSSGEANSSPPGGKPANLKAESEAKKAALAAYDKNNPGENGITAAVTNYGCHLQVDIQKDGKIVKSYSYQGGKISEIS